MILQNGINKKTTLTTMLKNLNSDDDIKINPLQNAIRTSIASKNDANLLYVDGVSDKIGIGTSSVSSHLLTVDGSIAVGSSTGDGVLVGSSEEINWSSGNPTKPLSIVRETSYVSVQTGYSGVFSLADGFDGQKKYISLVTASAGSTVVECSGINGAFTTINLTQKGNGVVLVYKGSGTIHGWSVVGNNGCTFS